MKPTITLSVQPERLDYIINVLGTRPYNEVRGVIDDLVKQANDPELQSWGPPPPVLKDNIPAEDIPPPVDVPI